MGMLEHLTSAAKAADPLASNAALKRCSTQKLKACWRRFLISLDQSGQRVPHPFDYAQGRLFAHFARREWGSWNTLPRRLKPRIIRVIECSAEALLHPKAELQIPPVGRNDKALWDRERQESGRVHGGSEGRGVPSAGSGQALRLRPAFTS